VKKKRRKAEGRMKRKQLLCAENVPSMKGEEPATS